MLAAWASPSAVRARLPAYAYTWRLSDRTEGHPAVALKLVSARKITGGLLRR